MVIHTKHSNLRRTDVETLKDELRRDTASLHLSNSNSQQVSDASPSSTPDHQRIPQTTMDNKSLATPPAYASSPLNAAAANGVVGNFPAVLAAAAAVQTTNPFLLAAALGLQHQQQQQQQNGTTATLPWINGAQSFTAMLPFLQQLQAQAQHAQLTQVALAQHIVAAQQAANLHQQLKTAAAAAAASHASSLTPSQQQQLQWLSPPPSVPPQVKQTTTCSSPLLSSGSELASTLSELSELSPRPHTEQQPPSPPASLSSSPCNVEKQQQFLFDEDTVIDSLLEERKDLSEKESIAVAVLAGMAACQR
ncbi:unnamed protein product [Gongylonema pulchrum]|uniref:POU domain protein n=1 Tax=Gongylonema pulchrum TaxID=637853 RepID=A0A183D8X3_9BILA|nr:unnamed protein product [Gongylonema pulchrum]